MKTWRVTFWPPREQLGPHTFRLGSADVEAGTPEQAEVLAQAQMYPGERALYTNEVSAGGGTADTAGSNPAPSNGG